MRKADKSFSSSPPDSVGWLICWEIYDSPAILARKNGNDDMEIRNCRNPGYSPPGEKRSGGFST
jgi:hypothetical protein